MDSGRVIVKISLSLLLELFSIVLEELALLFYFSNMLIQFRIHARLLVWFRTTINWFVENQLKFICLECILRQPQSFTRWPFVRRRKERINTKSKSCYIYLKVCSITEGMIWDSKGPLNSRQGFVLISISHGFNSESIMKSIPNNSKLNSFLLGSKLV